MNLAIQNPWWKNRLEIMADEKVKEALEKEVKVLYELKGRENKIINGKIKPIKAISIIFGCLNIGYC